MLYAQIQLLKSALTGTVVLGNYFTQSFRPKNQNLLKDLYLRLWYIVKLSYYFVFGSASAVQAWSNYQIIIQSFQWSK